MDKFDIYTDAGSGKVFCANPDCVVIRIMHISSELSNFLINTPVTFAPSNTCFVSRHNQRDDVAVRRVPTTLPFRHAISMLPALRRMLPANDQIHH